MDVERHASVAAWAAAGNRQAAPRHRRHEASLARIRGRRSRVHQRDPHLTVGGHARVDGLPEVVLWLPKQLLPESVGCFKNPSGTGYICP